MEKKYAVSFVKVFYCTDRLRNACMQMFLHCFSLAGTIKGPNIFEMLNILNYHVLFYSNVL